MRLLLMMVWMLLLLLLLLQLLKMLRMMLLQQLHVGHRSGGCGGGVSSVCVYCSIVVMATVDGRVAHAELIALGQRRLADGAGEAADVKDQIAGAHHQLRRADGRHAARAAFRAEDPVRRVRSGETKICD